MPMLDEREYEQVTSVRSKEVRLIDELVPVMAETKETNPNAIYHHRLSLYGNPCRLLR